MPASASQGMAFKGIGGLRHPKRGLCHSLTFSRRALHLRDLYKQIKIYEYTLNTIMHNDRRKQGRGRPRNPNKPAKSTSMKVYPATLSRIDKLRPYPRMSLCDRLDSILDEYEDLRKKVKAQEVEIEGYLSTWSKFNK
jgi:hypothetical protein